MASPGNQHCANCIGTLSFPMPSVQHCRVVPRRRRPRSRQAAVWSGAAWCRSAWRRVPGDRGTWGSTCRSRRSMLAADCAWPRAVRQLCTADDAGPEARPPPDCVSARPPSPHRAPCTALQWQRFRKCCRLLLWIKIQWIGPQRLHRTTALYDSAWRHPGYSKHSHVQS